VRLAQQKYVLLCGSAGCALPFTMFFVAVFEQVEDPKSKTFFSEIIASISDCKFTAEGNHIVARDYLTVKVCEMRVNHDGCAGRLTLPVCRCGTSAWSLNLWW